MSEVEQIILPDGFKRVEYLQSDRYQYIKIDLFDDGDKQLNNKGVWITWQPTTRYKYQNIFTCFNSDGSVFMTPHWNGDSNSILCGFVNRTNGAYRKSNYSLEFDKRYDSKLNYLNDGKAFINDTLIADINKNLTYTSDEFIVHLFGCNEDGNHSVVNSSYCKINRARITSGETITHDLIACLDADGRPCMYDLITNKPFYNEGIGEFSYEYSLPKGFKKVEYLQSSGTQWIDTGVVPDNETGLFLKAHRINGGDLVPVGARTNDIRFYPPRFNMDGVTIEYAWENYYVLGNRNTSDDLSYVSLLNFYNTRKASIQTQSNFYENALNTTLPSLSHTIYIFDWNYNGSATTHWIGKIYEVKISQGENLIRHFIPCLDNDGIPCMYDLVNDEVYYKEGDGEFNYPRDYPSSYYNLPAGYKKCVYLQSDGTQWVDTSVIPDNETGLYFKALQLTYGDFVPFGVTEGDNGIHSPRFKNKDLYYKWDGTSVKMMTWDKADDLIFHSSLNFYDSKIAKFNSEDTDVESFIISQTGTYTLPIWLFSYNFRGSYSASYGKWTGRVYRAQITQGTNLIHDYVPCLDADNRPCMYDLIDQEALYNQSGGTEFTYCVEHQLPSNFIKLKYLEDTGTQYINIEIIPTNETGLYVDAQQITHTNTHVMGSGHESNNTGFSAPRFLKGTANTCGFLWKGWNSYGNIGNGTRFEGYLNFFNNRKANLKTAGTTERINNLGELGFTPTASLHMFRTNYSSQGGWNGRIYRAKISEGTEIVRDFVPAFNQRNLKTCMYDLINNVAYYNDGEGEFLTNRDYEGDYIGCGVLGGIGNRLGAVIDGIVPPGYTRAEFLESTSQQAIMTGLCPEKLSSFVKWQITKRMTGQPIGYYNFDEHYSSEQAPNNNGTGVSIGVSTPSLGIVGEVIYDCPIGYMVESEVNADEGYVRINHKKKTAENLCVGYIKNLPNIDLFRQGYVTQKYFTGRIYTARFWRDGTDLINFIPCLDPNGKPCMFDTVNKKPFYNVRTNTTDFIVGLKTISNALQLHLPKKGGTITLSLPTNDKTEYYEEKIRANNPNWSITFQYH